MSVLDPAAEPGHDDLVAAVTEVTQETVDRFDRAYWLECVAEDRTPIELLTAMAEHDLLGVGVPTELGGFGGGLREQVAMVETMGRAGIPGYYFMIANFARNVVMEHGTREQKDDFVTPTVGAEIRPCFALTEPDAGTNTFAMKTTATRIDGG